MRIMREREGGFQMLWFSSVVRSLHLWVGTKLVGDAMHWIWFACWIQSRFRGFGKFRNPEVLSETGSVPQVTLIRSNSRYWYGRRPVQKEDMVYKIKWTVPLIAWYKNQERIKRWNRIWNIMERKTREEVKVKKWKDTWKRSIHYYWKYTKPAWHRSTNLIRVYRNDGDFCHDENIVRRS